MKVPNRTPGGKAVMRITAVTCVKNEGALPAGMDRLQSPDRRPPIICFYSNDCSDGTDRLLDALMDRGLVQHLPNPAQGRNYQMEALKDAKKREIVTEADWVWVADVDEFLNIHTGDHTIPALIEACGNPQAISVTFQFFANCGVEAYQDKPVIEQFTRSHNPDLWCGETAIEVKSLMRHDFPLQYFGAHRPVFSATNCQRRNAPAGPTHRAATCHTAFWSPPIRAASAGFRPGARAHSPR